MRLATLDLRAGTEVELHRAEESDVESVVALLADDDVARSRGDSAGAEVSVEYTEAFHLVDADPGQLLVVARTADGATVGTMQLTFIPGLSRRGATRMQIEAVRVAESQRGTGLGSGMIRWSLDEARRRGASLVQLTSDAVREDAHRFYEALGFSASHVGFKLAL